MDVIYIVNGLIIATLAIVVQLYFFSMINVGNSFNTLYIQFATLGTQLQDTSLSVSAKASLSTQFTTVETNLIQTCNTMMSDYSSFLNLSMLFTMYFVQNLLQILFAKLRKKKIEIITPEIVINFISCFVSLYQFCVWYFHYQQLSAPIPKYWCMYVANESFQDKFIKGVLGAGLIVSLQWCRVFFILQASRVFGPLIEILMNLLKELVKFIVIYGLIFMVFVSAGSCMFYNYSDFSSDNWRGFLYLFSASLGNFDFSLFTQDQTYIRKEYGWIYLILFLIITSIVLINFLIAILSNKYSEMQGKRKILYNKKILEIKQVQTDDKYYSCLISSFVPLNVLMIPFVPFIIFCKSEKLNRILMGTRKNNACYAPMIIFGVVLFVTANLTLLPFAYIVAVYSSFVNLIRIFKISKLTMKLILIEIGWLVIVIFLTVPFLLMQTIFDSTIFAITLFNENTKNKQDCGKTRSQSILIDPEVFDVLVNVVEISDEKIDVKEIILYFRERFRLVDQISALLFNLDQIEISDYKNKDTEEFKTSTENQNRTFESCKFRNINLNFDSKILKKYSPKEAINQYSSIKAFLLQNAITDNQNSGLMKSKIEKSLEKLKIANKAYPFGYISKCSFLRLIKEIKDSIYFGQILDQSCSSLSSSSRKDSYSIHNEPGVKYGFSINEDECEQKFSKALINLRISRNFKSIEKYYSQA